jgi:hypothetical protein
MSGSELAFRRALLLQAFGALLGKQSRPKHSLRGNNLRLPETTRLLRCIEPLDQLKTTMHKVHLTGMFYNLCHKLSSNNPRLHLLGDRAFLKVTLFSCRNRYVDTTGFRGNYLDRFHAGFGKIDLAGSGSVDLDSRHKAGDLYLKRWRRGDRQGRNN